jgi:hypothetical protein
MLIHAATFVLASHIGAVVHARLAVIAGPAIRTVTVVAKVFVDTTAFVLAGDIETVIHARLAVIAGPAGSA